jgi:hypothetical protein
MKNMLFMCIHMKKISKHVYVPYVKHTGYFFLKTPYVSTIFKHVFHIRFTGGAFEPV